MNQFIFFNTLETPFALNVSFIVGCSIAKYGDGLAYLQARVNNESYTLTQSMPVADAEKVFKKLMHFIDIGEKVISMSEVIAVATEQAAEVVDTKALQQLS